MNLHQIRMQEVSWLQTHGVELGGDLGANSKCSLNASQRVNTAFLGFWVGGVKALLKEPSIYTGSEQCCKQDPLIQPVNAGEILLDRSLLRLLNWSQCTLRWEAQTRERNRGPSVGGISPSTSKHGPSALGETLRRLTAKALLATVSKDWTTAALS